MLNPSFQLAKRGFLVHTGLFLSILFTGFWTQGVCDDQSYSQSTNDCVEPCSVFQDTQPTLEGKAGYFFFLNSTMRKIYNKGGIDVQVTGTYPIWRGLEFYGSVEFLERSGRSLGDKQKTRIYQIPVNVGLRPVLTLNNRVQYYATLGPRYFYVHQHNDSSFVPKNRGRSGVGFFANTGFNFMPIEYLVIDVFGEYSWAKTHFPNAKNHVYGRDLQIGGLTFGGGIGYVF